MNQPIHGKDKVVKAVLGVTLLEISPGSRSFSLFKSEKSSYTIGRGCHELFSGDFISKYHAKLEFQGQSIVISDLGSTNGTFLNSHPDRLVKDKRFPLRDGDAISFGDDPKLRVKVQLWYSDPPSFLTSENGCNNDSRDIGDKIALIPPDLEPPATHEKDKPIGVTLREVSQNRSLSLFNQGKSSYTIGRGCHELFSGDFISKYHAKLIFQDQFIVISDLGSTNGTFLNSHPDRLVKDRPYPLRDGDTIDFGLNPGLKVKVKFSYSDTPNFVASENGHNNDSRDIGEIAIIPPDLDPAYVKDEPIGVTLREVSPQNRSLSLFMSEKSSYIIGRNCHELFSGDFISRSHAKLEFQDHSTFISDLGSSNGTFLSSHIGPLTKGKQYLLCDGDTIRFGNDLRVEVRFLYSDNSPRGSHRLAVNASPSSRMSSQSRRGRSVTPNIHESENDNNDTLDILPEIITIPWELDNQLEIGHGYDAMAFRPKLTTALEKPSTAEVTKPSGLIFKRIQSSGDVFKDKNLHGSVLAKVADFAKVGLSRSSSHTDATSASTVVIYGTASETSTVSIKAPQLHGKAKSLLEAKDRAFYNAYGDYFVSGMEKSYGLVFIMTIDVNSQVVTDHVETEAITYLNGVYAGVGVGAGKKSSRGSSAHFIVQDIDYWTWGTTVQPSIKPLSHEEFHRAWETIKANPNGNKYENAILSSYSRHFQDFNKRPGSYRVYAEQKEVVDMYVKLQHDRLHPGVTRHHLTQKLSASASETFERLRYTKEGLLHSRTKLLGARDEVEKSLRLYAFFSEVSSLKGKIIPPSEGNKHKARWICGKINGKMLPSDEDEFHEVKLDNNTIPAMEAVFLRPLKSSRSKNFIPNIGSSPIIINFRSASSGLATFVHSHPEEPVDAWKACEYKCDIPIVIVGWSVSHKMAKEKTTVVHSSGGLLDNSLSIKIIEPPKGNEQWHCRVTFVFEHDYRCFL